MPHDCSGLALAGIVIAAVGEGYCFLIDGISYLAVIVSLLMMTVVRQKSPLRLAPVAEQFVEGWKYVTHSVPIRSILILLAVASLSVMPYTVLMPITAARVLHGSAHTLGYLMAASGFGALMGAVSLAMRKTVLGLGKRIVICACVLGVSLIGFGLSRNLWLSLAVLPVVGFCTMQHMAASNTILQTIVDEEKRGRVMSFYSMAFQGMAPFGSLIAGVLAARIGTPEAVMWSGVPCIAGALWFAHTLPEIRHQIRPIYVQLGILPESALGVQQASALQNVKGS